MQGSIRSKEQSYRIELAGRSKYEHDLSTKKIPDGRPRPDARDASVQSTATTARPQRDGANGSFYGQVIFITGQAHLKNKVNLIDSTEICRAWCPREDPVPAGRGTGIIRHGPGSIGPLLRHQL
jgi:hypothetical protein